MDGWNAIAGARTPSEIPLVIGIPDMMTGTTTAPWVELDDFIEAFERAQARGVPSDLAHFLPEAPHPLYQAILSELIRVDLEYSWKRGDPKRVEDYQTRFPQIFTDRDALEGIAFEEYRLRLQAGEFPSLGEYQRRFGLTFGKGTCAC